MELACFLNLVLSNIVLRNPTRGEFISGQVSQLKCLPLKKNISFWTQG
jgi:hypothetical protein